MNGVRNWLKRLRIAKGYLTQDALAESLEVSVRTIKAWESGEKTPHGPNRAKLALALGPTEVIFRFAFEELQSLASA